MATVNRKSIVKKDKTAPSTKTPAKKPNARLLKIAEAINKEYGGNVLNVGFDNQYSPKVLKRIPTGSFTLDIALGGGIPVGRFTEISGAYSSTKTTQIIHIIREAQKMGMTVAFADAEGTTDELYLKSLGVNTDSLLYFRPAGMEEACQILLELQKTGDVHLGIIDSIAALSPNKEQEVSIEETVRMGIPQQILGEFFRKYQANNNRLDREGKQPFTLVCANQLREKIGAYGDPEYTPGGRAKGFTCSVDLRLRKGDWLTQGTGVNKEIVGQVVKFKVEKNKTYKRMQDGEFDFYFAENEAGVPVSFNDNEKEVVICAVDFGIIERSGGWFSYESKKWQGLPKLVEALKKDRELFEEIKNKTLYVSTRENR